MTSFVRLFAAIEVDDVKALEHHINQFDLLPSDTKNWIGIAVSFNAIQCVRLLIAKKFPIDSQKYIPTITYWNRICSIEMGFLLIEHGARTKGDNIFNSIKAHSIRLQLANCRLAQRALLRCGRAKIHRDILPKVAAAVWSTRMNPEWVGGGKVK